MKNVLLLTSSPRGEAAFSTQVATELAQKIEGANLTTRELWRDNFPHITPDFIGAIHTPEDGRTPEQSALAAISDELIAELKAADIVIIASGMINFAIPSTLKAWIDYVVRSGETFNYDANGLEGLVKGKQTVLVLATGGIYSEGPMAPMNFQEPYLRTVLGFIGLTEVETVLIEGSNLGPDVAAKALASAREKVAELSVTYSN